MTPTELQRIIRETVQAEGFSRHGKGWILLGTDAAWLLALDTRHSHRYSIEVGIDLYPLSGTVRPKSINFCHILTGLEQMKSATGVGTYEVRQAFSLDFDMDDESRHMEVRRILTALTDYAHGHPDVNSLRQSHAAGELRPSIMLREARTILEGPLRGNE
ncbi:hypothetical protein [Arthrobacter sp. NPDC058127]|uniref:hypothetical protein n=1 Tax=Arthrobacter sp. NPDC058127 TaxID=3346351 RepID=UPI0036EAEEFD